MKKLFVIMLALLMIFSMAACNSNEAPQDEQNPAEENQEQAQTPDPNHPKIIMGTMATNIDSVEAGRASLEAMGYELEVMTFDDITMPNTALLEGSIDANYYQHKYYMESFNEANNADLYMLEPQLTYTRCAAYSDKWDSVDELPDGAMVTISSDATNKSRALLILQDLGLIKLDGEKEVYTELDIVDNPKNLQFTEVTGAQVYSTLPDVDMIVIYNKYWLANDRSTDEAWITEGDRFEFAQGIVIDGANKEEQWAKDLIAAYTSDETKANLEAISGGVFDVLF